MTYSNHMFFSDCNYGGGEVMDTSQGQVGMEIRDTLNSRIIMHVLVKFIQWALNIVNFKYPMGIEHREFQNLSCTNIN